MDNKIRTCLEKLGYEHIRPNQETVIKEYLQGKDGMRRRFTIYSLFFDIRNSIF